MVFLKRFYMINKLSCVISINSLVALSINSLVAISIYRLVANAYEAGIAVLWECTAYLAPCPAAVQCAQPLLASCGVVLAVDAINRQQHGVHALGTAVVDKEGHIYPVDVTDEA